LDSKTTPIEVVTDSTQTMRSQAPPPAWFRFLVPSVADLIFIVLLATMTGGVLALRLLGDASIGWHIRNGELMLRTHSITRIDPFSITMGGQAWYAWEWLYDIVIAGMLHWFGLNGVVLLTAVIIATTFALTLRLSLRRGADLALAVILLALSLGASMIHLLARLRELALVTAASLVASLINPYGYKLHEHVYRYLSSRWLMNHIDEFLSPNFHGVAQQCFVAILLIAVVALAFAGKKLTLSQLLVLLFAAYSGLYASRNLPVSSLFLTLIVAPLLTQAVCSATSNSDLSFWLRSWFSKWASFGDRMGTVETHFRGHAWPLLAVTAGLLVCAQQGRAGAQQWIDAHFDTTRFPVQAVDAMVQRNIREPVFAPDSWGGYLIYRLYPQNKVFVDDRHDLYGEQFLKDYLKTLRLTPEWADFLNQRRVKWVLVPAESALANMLSLTQEWRVVYRDGASVLFERSNQEP